MCKGDRTGLNPKHPIPAPVLLRGAFAGSTRSRLVLGFDQPVRWDPALVTEFRLDGDKGLVASGKTDGPRLILTLHQPSQAKTLTYLDSASWNPERVLRGLNGIAALTFCEVPLEPTPAPPSKDTPR